MLTYILIGIGAGVAGGFFGIGGATIMVPALIYFFKFTQHQAQGTTLAAMIPPIGILAAWRYYSQGNVNVLAAVCLAGGFLIGGYAGAMLVEHVPDILLKRLFGVFLLSVGLRMIFS